MDVTPRDYPPAASVHDPSRCEHAPPGILMSPRAAAEAYPNARPHTCFTRDTITAGRAVVVEHIDYEPHRYQPSTIQHESGINAIRPLCKICRGTHGDAPPATGPSGLLITRG